MHAMKNDRWFCFRIINNYQSAFATLVQMYTTVQHVFRYHSPSECNMDSHYTLSKRFRFPNPIRNNEKHSNNNR